MPHDLIVIPRISGAEIPAAFVTIQHFESGLNPDLLSGQKDPRSTLSRHHCQTSRLCASPPHSSGGRNVVHDGRFAGPSAVKLPDRLSGNEHLVMPTLKRLQQV